MRTTECHGSSAPASPFGRSILGIRRDQVHAMDPGAGDGSGHGQELEAFQQHAADLFHDLAGGGGEGSSGSREILSIAWVCRLLDVFLICLEEFHKVLFSGLDAARPPPLDRLVADFFDRAVKALDICNAVRDGIGQMKQWLRHIDIVLTALDPKQKVLTSGQFRRAKKALTDLTILMLDEKEAFSVLTHRNRSFDREGGAGVRSGGHFRSLSWSVSRSWSAAKQLQAIGSNLAAPRGHDMVATNGLAAPVFAMNTVLLFTVWALVAAMPCQDRGLQTHFSPPRSFPWAVPVATLHERILEESKRKVRKHSNGLLKEIHQVEKCTRRLIDLIEAAELRFGGDKEMELRQEVEELAGAYASLKEGLEPMERLVREVFHRIVCCRTDGFDCGILQS